jgi:hypothetical protein
MRLMKLDVMQLLMSPLVKLEAALRTRAIHTPPDTAKTKWMMTVMGALGGLTYLMGYKNANTVGFGFFIGAMAWFLYRINRECPLLYGLCEAIAGIWVIIVRMTDIPDHSTFTERLALLIVGIYLIKKGIQGILDKGEEYREQGIRLGLVKP